LNNVQRKWSVQLFADDIGPTGSSPALPGGPELLIGGYSPAAINRVGRWGEGYLAGGAAPPRARQSYELAEQAWKAAGRTGKPRFVACMYWGLGSNAAERAASYLRHYYASMGPMAEQIASSVPSTPEAVKGAIQGLTDVGADELIGWPCSPALHQMDR